MPMETPCIKQCKLVNDKCSGCGRTKGEIMAWTKLEDNERKRIIERVTKESK